MTVVMAVTPTEASLLDAHLAFHLNAGVDLVIAQPSATDGDVREILDRYARDGLLVRPDASIDGTIEATARLAATTYSGDWLIWSDPTEFWWPRAAQLSDVLVAIPPRYGVVQALVRRFVARAGDDGFTERMTVRDSLAQASAGDEPLLDRLRPIRRLERGVGLHGGQPLRAWYPVEVLRFPGLDVAPVPEDAIARGLEDGSLVVDERLRDALRALRGDSTYRLPSAGGTTLLDVESPTVVDDALYAVECAAVGEVNLDRLDRQIRDLENRLSWLESRLWPRVRRSGSRLLRGRIRRRG